MPSCGSCGKGFSSGGCAGIHAARWETSCKDSFKYDCSNCMEVCNTKNRRRTHMNNQHTGAQCQQCDKPFYDASRRDQHQLAKVHNDKKQEAKQKQTSNLQSDIKAQVMSKDMSPTQQAKHEPPSSTQNAAMPAVNQSSTNTKGECCESKTTKPLDVNRQARYFHDNHARCSNPQKDAEIFKAFREVSNGITDALKEKGLISRKEYAGSTWERTNIPGSSDFDVLLVNRDSKDQVKLDTGPDVPKGYAHLTKDDKVFSPSTQLNQTKSNIQKIINEKDFGKYQVKMRSHGPAVQIDVHVKGREATITSIDLVPTLEKPDGQMFVAKSPKLEPSTSDTYWRKSHSLAAKEKLLSADSGNCCRREVYRTCKVLRNAEPNLSHVTSYQLKTALFNVMDHNPRNEEWSRDKLGEGTIRVLGELRDAYRAKTLPDYYEPDIDLIRSTKEDAAANTANRLDYLIKHPEKLFD